MAVDYNTYLKWVESQQNGTASLQAQQVVQLFKNRDSGPSAAAKPSDVAQEVDQIVNASVVQPEITERRKDLRVSNSPKHSVSSESSKGLCTYYVRTFLAFFDPPTPLVHPQYTFG